ncbi:MULTISPECIES: Acg family FMN-binding oxidoreductase [unclassified Spirillospora]|uniref:Acg family FMN-binding oxidoreductase n=1 Tax=unclassified Spirillospora TaxID=2642701 RepID=UPI00372047B6
MSKLDVLPRREIHTDLAARFVIRAATMAPSVHNTQPWRFGTSGEAIRLYADDHRRLPWSDPAGRELVISCGAALFNLRLAMRHLGFTARITPFPVAGQPDLLAEIHWGWNARPSSYEEVLFRALSRRHSHRGLFTCAPVPNHLISELRGVTRRQQAFLSVISDRTRLRHVARLVHAAETAQRADSGVASELERWVPVPGDERLDGVPATAYPRQPDGAVFATRDFARGAPLGYPPSPRLASPTTLGVVAVLSTRRDRPADWLQAGLALQAVLLHAAAHQVSAAFHTQPLELPGPRARIRKEVIASGHPQMLLRLGYSDRPRATPRRPVTEVLTEQAS